MATPNAAHITVGVTTARIGHTATSPAAANSIEMHAREFYSGLSDSMHAAAEYVLAAFPALYRRTLHDLRGRFSRGELLLMIDVNNGLVLTPGLAGQHLGAQVSDGIDLDGLDAKWDVDRKTILDRLASLRVWEAAILELWIAAYWASHEREALDLEKYVIALI